MNLVESIQNSAKQQGHKSALLYQEHSTTYAELQQVMVQFASGLLQLGVKPGDHIAIVLGNTPQFIYAMYGAWRAGAAVIPINPMYTPDEIEFILENGDVSVLVTTEEKRIELEPCLANLTSLKHVICHSEQIGDFKHPNSTSFAELLVLGRQQAEQLSFPDIDTDNEAIILYTSGTTGKPKGAILTHRNLYANASDVGVPLGFSAQDKVIAALPLFHVFCLTVGLNASFVMGATVLLLPKFSPAEVFRETALHQATVFLGVPTMYNYLLQYPNGTSEALSSIRVCISGGASMPEQVMLNFESKFGLTVHEGYGLSEASPVTCFNGIDRPRKIGSIGTSIEHVENKIVNPDGNEVPCGQVGELVVRGPNVMKGYYKAPEKTAETIRNGWLFTGDLARQDEEGYFYIVDRKKDMILVGGYNVYPREVEEVLYRHPEIAEVAVVGTPDDNLGESVCVFAVRKVATLSEQDILEYCTAHLAKYKVPSKIIFMESLPKNSTGKIMKRSLVSPDSVPAHAVSES